MTESMPTGGRWGWYRDHEGNEWRRVSKLVKYCETDTYNLDQWMKRQVAEGLAIRDDLVLAVKAMGRPDPLAGWSKDDKKKLDDIVKDAMSAAKQRDGARAGTALHDLTERRDRGEDIENVVRGLPAPTATIIRAYDFLVRENKWQHIAIERTVVIPELECAGTFDRVTLVPGLRSLLGPGECQYGHAAAGLAHDPGPDTFDELPVIADVKSESQPWLNGLHIAPQLAIYSRARRMWERRPGTVKVRYSVSGDEVEMPAGEYVPVPCVRQDVGVVVHTSDGAAEPYFVDLSAGWAAAQAAYAQAKRETASKRKLGEPGAWFVAMPGVVRPKVAEMMTEQAVAENYAGGAQVATKRADGQYEWRPAAGTLDTVDRQAIETIWAATAIDDLSKTWDIYVNTIGRQWGGRVAEAADARQRQIQCPQRALHTAGRCACGWVAGQGPA